MEIQKEKDILFELCDKGKVYFIHKEYVVHILISLENVYEYNCYKLEDLGNKREPHDGGVCNGTPLDAIRMSIE